MLFHARLLDFELFGMLSFYNTCLVIGMTLELFAEVVDVFNNCNLRKEALMRDFLPPLPLLFLRALGIKVEILVVKGAIRLTIIVILDKFVTASQGTR